MDGRAVAESMAGVSVLADTFFTSFQWKSSSSVPTSQNAPPSYPYLPANSLGVSSGPEPLRVALVSYVSSGTDPTEILLPKRQLAGSEHAAPTLSHQQNTLYSFLRDERLVLVGECIYALSHQSLATAYPHLKVWRDLVSNLLMQILHFVRRQANRPT